ncbi:MAG TPA: transcriptional repressor [Ktedonobacteraceae bacterium]|jgi:Fe2+ or Zn2+ uptake regulation protein
MKATLNENAQAVLSVVQIFHSHPTAAEVYEVVREKRPRIGIASVYRILHNLVEQGYIKELRHSDESCRYDAHIERHDHAICIICGALLDVPIEVKLPQDVLQAAAEAAGIELGSHELRLYGRCLLCNTSKGQTVHLK